MYVRTRSTKYRTCTIDKANHSPHNYSMKTSRTPLILIALLILDIKTAVFAQPGQPPPPPPGGGDVVEVTEVEMLVDMDEERPL